MNTIYDPENLRPGFVPAVYGYYDRANMMESTPEVINHSHPLCEIMYVNEGAMSIETESNGFNQVSCSQFIWIDAGIRHWDLRFNNGLCSMMNIEFQYEEGASAAPDLASLLKTDGMLRDMFDRKPRVMTLSDRNGVIYQLMKSIIPLADSTSEQDRNLCSLLCTQVMLEVARLRSLNQSRESVGNHYISEALDILNGRKADPTFYPVVYSAPESADWTDPRVWMDANPSLGRTVDLEFYENRCNSAKENPAEEIQFRQFHLCQWTNTAVRWMPMDKWDACLEDFTGDDLLGKPCYAGLDLSSTSDLTALVLVFPPTGEEDPYRVLPFFWLPKDTLQLRVRRDHVMYDVWEKQGFIQTTEGNVVHYGFIEEFIRQLGERFEIREIAYDRWNASLMVQALEDDGFTMVPFGQGFRDMSNPTKDLMRLVLEGSLRHNRHPVLRWNMDNVFIRTDPAGNLKIDKQKSTEKVDGAVALVMALDRAMKNQNGASVYDERGLLII